MKIIKREPLGSIPVYDLGISTSVNMHNFVLENGLVASNCFNKAHSISYSFLTYISAYLKTHYPVEFFAALMSTRSKTLQPKSWALKAHEYISEAQTFDVEILPPDINRSSFDFTVDGTQIYFGFNAIRDVGKTAARSIMNTRRSTPFKDIKDFVSRVNLQKVNTKTFEALVKAGSFDQLGYSRLELLKKTSELYSYHKDLEDYNTRKVDITSRELHNSKVAPLIERRNFLRKEVKKIARKIEKGKETPEELDIYSYHTDELENLEEQKLKKLPPLKEKDLPIFPTFERNKILELSLPQVLDQAHYIGCYIGGHPITMLNISKNDIASLEEYDKDVKVAGVVVTYRQIVTRKGQKMAFLEIDDSTATAEVVLFPHLFKRYEKLEISEGDILTLNVKVESISPEIKLIPNKINKYRIENEMDS
jgi:DNA polymerase-3 subunit alpha